MPTPHKGTWEVLSYDAQVHAIHAMLLHTGQILYFDDDPKTCQAFIKSEGSDKSTS